MTMSRYGWCLVVVCVLGAACGCATEKPKAADPFAQLEERQVKFIPKPPPDAKFIAEVCYTCGSSQGDWQQDCAKYLRKEAVKLGGNAVVFGTKIRSGSGLIFRGPGLPSEKAVMARVQIWSDVYFCAAYR